MIKFFRSIRRSLLEKGHTVKYIKYAVGEIVLVVIGILIALSINNKNSEIANRKAEKTFYHNIKEQLLDDAKNIESVREMNLAYTAQFEYAIKIIETENRIQKDTLGNIAVNLTNYTDFDRQGNIYETMVNSGDIKLLTNTDIIEKLRRLEETYIYVNRMETIHFDAVMSLVPSLMESIRLFSSTIEDENYLYSYKSQNMFVISLKIMNEKETVYHRAIKEIEEIIALLDKEIE